jgi:hypothetical protein
MATQTDRPTPRRSGRHFRVPHTLAFGASFRPRPLHLSAEVTHLVFAAARRLRHRQAPDGWVDSFTIDDGIEIHGGVQYHAALA